MTELLALGSAALFGIGDFFGGRGSRLTSAFKVTFVAYVVSALCLIPAMFVIRATEVTAGDLVWGAVGGIAGLAGVIALYAALAKGQMGVVAPLTAVLSALVPVTWGFLTGGRPGPIATAGIALALVAIAVVSGSEGPSGVVDRSIMVLGLGAGLGFGLFFIALDQTSLDAGVWPLVAARGATIPIALGFALRTGPMREMGGAMRYAVAAGVFDMAANVLFLSATQRGLVAIAATLSALYPVSTALLARFVLHERMSRTQVMGVGIALLAVVLIGWPTG